MTLGQIVDRMERKSTRSWTNTWANPSWWNLFVVLPWAIGAIFFVHEWRVDREIAGREQTTQGVITAHEPANHNRYGYVFSVSGKRFTGWETARKDELGIGKQVLVYYDPHDPNKNALISFRDLSINSLGPVPTILFGIGGVAWYIGSRRRQNKMDSPQSVPPQVPTH